MNPFCKKSLCTALAAATSLVAAGTAQAVFVSPDHLGQVLIYPYYTVRSVSGRFGAGAYNSLLSVVNTSSSAKAVKVRFREGMNGVPVLDFNLYLSARDSWTAAITPSATGTAIGTSDRSCTTPARLGPDFSAALLTDGAGSSPDRTREGYVEIIEMGDVIGGSTVETEVSQRADGAPPCTPAFLQDGATMVGAMTLGRGGLFGSMTLINVNTGYSAAVDAVALASFNRRAALYTPAGSSTPTLADAWPPEATIFRDDVATVFTFDQGIDAVSATLMQDSLSNEVVLDTVTASGTDWVITFPTKNAYVSTSSVRRPFSLPLTPSGACDSILVVVWDREQRHPSYLLLGGQPDPAWSTLCWAANVVTWESSDVLGSKNSRSVDYYRTFLRGFENGWSKLYFNLGLKFGGPNRLESKQPNATFFGLPAIGFNLFTFNNASVVTPSGPVRAVFGQAVPHKTERLIGPP